MSSTIDERVVEMRFDNKQFEQNAKTSISTIERLKQALNFSSSTSGLDNIQRSVERVNMDGLGNAVDSVKLKFSALQVAAITALSNIVNRAVNAGVQLAKSLTISPITQGFNEYELKMGSIQTILANTSQTQGEVSQEAIESVNAAAEEAAVKSEELNEQAIKNLQKRNKEELKALDKQIKAQTKALTKQQQLQSKALSKRQQEETEQLQESEKKKLQALQDAQEEQMETLQKNYDSQYEALEKSEEEQISLLQKNHKEKLEMYNEEYMQKLKAADESRYNQIKAIEDEIESIENLSKAEKKEKDEAAKQEKLNQLNSRLERTETQEEREYILKQIADYEAELEEERVAEERKNRIEELKQRKEDVQEEYDTVKNQIKEEYNTKVEAEDDLYAEEYKKIQENMESRRKAIQENYAKELENLQDRQEKEQEALQKRQENEQEALAERQENERDALSERQENERDALSERQSDQRDALSERQSAEMEAMEERHKAELENIQTEKEARLAALQAAAPEKEPTSLEDVTKALGELNEYADKTIYNFADMTKNIGTFTAAGVDLDTSVDAIKGIANLAALSGSSSQQASTAMYQLSQAIATGRVNLQDWNSVVNAGMGGKAFQNSLIETARVHDIEVDKMISKQGSFRNSLQEGWLTSDILLETLQKFTGDLTEEQLKSMGYTDDQIADIIELGKTAVESATKVRTWTQLLDTTRESVGSGWAETFELIFGDFNEATDLWTGLSDAIGGFVSQMSDSRNNLLRGWKISGGRDDLIEAFKNLGTAVMKVLKPIQEAFRDIFPKTTSADLVKLTKNFKNLTSRFSISDDTAKKLKSTFSGLFAVIDIIKQAVSAFLKIISPGIGIVGGLADKVLALTAGIGDWLTWLDKSIKKNDAFTKAAGAISDVIGKTIQKFKDLVAAVKNWASDKIKLPDTGIFTKFLDKIKELPEEIKKWKKPLSGANDILEPFRKKITEVKDAAKTAIEKLKEFITSIKSWVESKFKAPDLSFITDVKDKTEKAENPIKTFIGLLGEGFKKVASLFSKAGKGITDTSKNIWNGLSSFIKGVSDFFSSEGMEKLASFAQKGAITTLILAISNFVSKMSQVAKNGASLVKGFGAIKKAIVDTFGAVQKQIKAKALKEVATGLLIIAGALAVLTLVDQNKLATSMAVLSAMLLELVAVIDHFDGLEKTGKSLKNYASVMLAMGASVLLLAMSVKKIGDLDTDSLAGATAAIGILLASLGGVIGLLSKYGKNYKTSSLTLLSFAGSVLILAQGIKTLGELDTGTLIQGGIAVAALMGALTGFTYVAGKAEKALPSSVGVLAVASALLVLAVPLAIYGKMKITTLAQGLITIGTSLYAFSKFMNQTEIKAGVATGMLAMSTALLVLAVPLAIYGKMKLTELAKGLITTGGALAIFAVAMNHSKISAGVGTGMLAMAAAILVLTPALIGLGKLSIGEMVISLVALAGAFTVIGVAGAVLGPLAPSILSLSGSVALFGVAVAGVGIGILSFAAGLTMLSAGGVAAAASFIASMKIIVPGLLQIAKDSLPMIIEILVDLIKDSLEGIAKIIPSIAESIFKIIAGILEEAVKYGPQIVALIVDFIVSIIGTLAEKMPEIVTVVVDLFVSFFASIIEALKNLDTETLEDAVLGIGLVAGFLAAMAGFSAIAGPAIAGIAGAALVVAELAVLLTAIGALSKIPGLTWLIEGGGELLKGIGTAIGGFVGGIVGGIMEGVTSVLPQIGTDLSDFMTNASTFIEGAKNIDETAMNGVKTLAETILILSAADIIDGIARLFDKDKESPLTKFGKELAEFGPYFSDYYESVKDVKGDVVEASANAASALSEMANNLPKHGGYWQTLFGDSSLSTFAEELKDFAPAIKGYSDTISADGGIDEDAITASANAASVLSEVAKNLPKSGGYWQKFFGEVSLSSFAEQLEDFAPAIKGYSDTISADGGIDSAAVEDSANAAKALSGLADNLPSSGGFLQSFLGEQDLSDFAEQLIAFGPAIKGYSDTISANGGIKEGAVTSSVNAAKALMALNDAVPDSKGFLSFFTGENDLSSFGKKISSFGSSMSEYYGYVGSIDTVQLTNIADSVGEIIDIATEAKDLDTKGLKGLNKAMTTLGKDGLAAFVAVYTESQETVDSAMAKMIGFATAKIELDTPTLEESATGLGESAGSSLVTGIGNKKDDVSAAAGGLATTIKTSLTIGLPNTKFTTLGKNIGSNLSIGMKSEESMGYLKTGTDTICSSIIGAIGSGLSKPKVKAITADIGYWLYLGMVGQGNTTYANAKSFASTYVYTPIVIALSYDNFYIVGGNIGVGLANGMTAKQQTVKKAASNLASCATGQINSTLEVNSPSKVSTRSGMFVGVGLANGILNSVKVVAQASEKLGDTALDPLKLAIDKISSASEELEDFTPTISPTLDLSNVIDGASQISSMFKGGLTIATSSAFAEQASSEFDRNRYGYSNTDREEEMERKQQEKLDRFLSSLKDLVAFDMTNTFNISSTDPREAADEIDRVLQHQVERRKAVWGR